MPGLATSSPASLGWQGWALAEEAEAGSPSQSAAGLLPQTPLHERWPRGWWASWEVNKLLPEHTHPLLAPPIPPPPGAGTANVRARD